MRRNTYFGAGAWAQSGEGYLAQGYFASGAPADVEPHGHDLAHVVFLLHSGYASCARAAPEVTAGPAIIFNPAGIEHADKFVAGAAAFVTVSFTAAFLEPFAEPDAPLYLENAKAISQARRLHGCGLGGALSEDASDDAVLELLDRVIGAGARRSDCRLVARAKALLLDSDMPWRIGALADELDTHPVHLARVFRHAEGCSPAAFRTAARVTRGAELLRRTHAPVTQIAHDLGFADHAHFTREFRKLWGVSPLQYRHAC